MNQIRAEIENSDSDHDREKLQERLAKLVAASQSSRPEPQLKLSSRSASTALKMQCATPKAAVEEGIVAGGGVALIQAGEAAFAKLDLTGEEATGANIVKVAIEARSNRSRSTLVSKAELLPRRCATWSQVGASTQQRASTLDLHRDGVIDPAKVTRSALQNAASIAALFPYHRAVVADKPDRLRCQVATAVWGYGL